MAVDEHDPFEVRSDLCDQQAQSLLADRDGAGKIRAVAGDAVRHRRKDEHVELAPEAVGRPPGDAHGDDRVRRERRVGPMRLGRAERE
jgi:hypothetical protein